MLGAGEEPSVSLAMAWAGPPPVDKMRRVRTLRSFLDETKELAAEGCLHPR